MMTQHSVMTSSLFIKMNVDDFSSDIDYNSKTDMFRDVIPLKINQCPVAKRKQAKRAYHPYY